MADTDPMNDLELDDMFAAARRSAPVSDGLRARVLADADGVIAALAPPVQAAPRPGRMGLWAMILAATGGWAAMAGMATAAVTGLWVGLASPESVEGYLTGTFATESTYTLGDLMPDLDLLAEGG